MIFRALPRGPQAARREFYMVLPAQNDRSRVARDARMRSGMQRAKQKSRDFPDDSLLSVTRRLVEPSTAGDSETSCTTLQEFSDHPPRNFASNVSERLLQRRRNISKRFQAPAVSLEFPERLQAPTAVEGLTSRERPRSNRQRHFVAARRTRGRRDGDNGAGRRTETK